MIAALLLLAAAPIPALPSVFGLQLGAPVTLPECKRMELRYPTPGELPPYISDQPILCKELPIQLSDAPFQRGSVNFPHGTAPDFIVANGIQTYFWTSSLVAIEASTVSYASAGIIIFELTAKFGKPSSDVVHQQVIDGMPVPSRHAVWNRPGYTVDYEAISDSDINYGELWVRTSAYDQVDDAAAVAKDTKRTPL